MDDSFHTPQPRAEGYETEDSHKIFTFQIHKPHRVHAENPKHLTHLLVRVIAGDESRARRLATAMSMALHRKENKVPL